MSIDLSKLTPAPWEATRWRVCAGIGEGERIEVVCDTANNKETRTEANALKAAFIALARNAFDVMMRRGWHANLYKGSPPEGGMWYVDVPEMRIAIPAWPDPFTALVEADKWYRENMEPTS